MIVMSPKTKYSDSDLKRLQSILYEALQYEDTSIMHEYLYNEFADKKLLFTQFVSFCYTEILGDFILDITNKQTEKLIKFYTALTTIAMTIGRENYTEEELNLLVYGKRK